jgi:hypothetical protein
MADVATVGRDDDLEQRRVAVASPPRRVVDESGGDPAVAVLRLDVDVLQLGDDPGLEDQPGGGQREAGGRTVDGGDDDVGIRCVEQLREVGAQLVVARGEAVLVVEGAGQAEQLRQVGGGGRAQLQVGVVGGGGQVTRTSSSVTSPSTMRNDRNSTVPGSRVDTST